MKIKALLLVMVAAISLACGILWFKIIDIDNISYIFFTVSFFVLLSSSFIKPFSELFLLVNIFLFLGFWGKGTAHLLKDFRWGEAAGNSTTLDMRHAFVSAGWAALILLMLQLILRKINQKINYSNKSSVEKVLPPSLIILLMIATCTIALINWKLGFLRVGLASEMPIIFPFNVLLSWFLGPGSAFLTFLVVTEAYSLIGTFAIAISMAAVSISTLSRNTLMYFAYPVFIRFISNIKDYKKGSLHSLFILFFFLGAIIQISHLRKFFYFEKNEVESFSDIQKTQSQMSELFLERWVGLEGLLVGQANESDENFKTMIFENPTNSSGSIYTRLSSSRYIQKNKFLFFTFPGPIGLIFMAKSLWLKLIGWLGFLTIFSAMYLVIETFFVKSIKSAISWWVSTILTQLSLFPLYYMKVFSVYFCLMIAIVILFNKIDKENREKVSRFLKLK